MILAFVASAKRYVAPGALEANHAAASEIIVGSWINDIPTGGSLSAWVIIASDQLVAFTAIANKLIWAIATERTVQIHANASVLTWRLITLVYVMIASLKKLHFIKKISISV